MKKLTQFEKLSDSINELFSVRENEEIILKFDFKKFVCPKFRIDYCGDFFYLDEMEVVLTNENNKNTIVPYTYHPDGTMVVLNMTDDYDDIYEIVHTMFGLDAYDLDVETLPEDVVEMKKKLRLLLEKKY